jgi:hypothetical protein
LVDQQLSTTKTHVMTPALAKLPLEQHNAGYQQ